MLKRTIYVGNPAYLKLKDHQLNVEDPATGTINGTVPVEDMGFLVLDHSQITLTHPLMVALQQNNVGIISCDAYHLPISLMLPLAGHVEHSRRLREQTNLSEPLRKQLWKQTVETKIYQQKCLLQKLGHSFEPMLEYMNEVKSGDTTNREGIAAQYYWKQMFENFTRERKGETPNQFLNYGYSLLRSMVARALVSSGLNPTLGLFHKNKYNPYGLADDVMEPYRPFVDEMVVEWLQQNLQEEKLSKSAKLHFLQLPTRDVRLEGSKKPLLVALSSTTSSLYKCIIGENRIIRYPEFV
ncbi:type II CRISPR-associated endonuclease Cas1 [Apibacter muscae]|uniref:type II CRISPR-associated endonuclease Cas1 n=1 Tax=Apibacter muscae TaxID=2509004 RepID=UPI0011AC73F0|nr:type II CRISPR-associated endonuclease Cas1 [Apibacter muscae]TWP22827.1 type II CRISPR-associated endonuclease Cas1 [Apibacter muscae]